MEAPRILPCCFYRTCASMEGRDTQKHRLKILKNKIFNKQGKIRESWPKPRTSKRQTLVHSEMVLLTSDTALLTSIPSYAILGKFLSILPVYYLYLFIYFIFWLRAEAFRILVPQPGIELRPTAVKTQSPHH